MRYIIFMTATPYFLEKQIEFEGIETQEYITESNYDYIENLYFYNDDRSVELILKNILDENKAMYFVNSTMKSKSIIDKYYNSTLICSKNNSTSANMLMLKFTMI